MNIGVDIRSLLEEKRSGVGEYTVRLLDAVFSIDHENKYFLFYNSYKDKDKLLPKEWNNLPHVTFVKFSYPNKLFNFCLRFFSFPKIDKLVSKKVNISLDIFFLPNLNFVALSDNIKKIITAHDLSFERYSSFFSLKRRLWHILVSPKKLFNSFDRIIAISKSTENDLEDIYKIKEKKIKLIYSGTIQKEDIDFDKEKKDKIKSKYGLPDNFILFFGTVEPRKNIVGLIRAFEILKRKEKFEDLNLVIVGSFGWLYKKILQRAQRSSCASKIIFIDYVSEEEKFYFYQLAKVFVYISFYEGFGFPPLEAAACGVPTVVSASSSALEVLGNAALLCDPNNPKEVAEAIKQYLKDEAFKNRMIALGEKRVEMFNWNRSAEIFINLLAARKG